VKKTVVTTKQQRTPRRRSKFDGELVVTAFLLLDELGFDLLLISKEMVVVSIEDSAGVNRGVERASESSRESVNVEGNDRRD